MPAKINLALRVGPRRPDGFHDLATVFQAVDVCDYVTVSPAETLSIGGPPGIPLDASNLAWRAAAALAEFAGIEPGAHIEIEKVIPVAGGMAGGSADAAATLVACNELWELRATSSQLEQLAAGLGSDVPFALRGGTALGLGRGDELTTVFGHGRCHWVVQPAGTGLSTPAVYRELDRLRPDAAQPTQADVADVLAAVQTGSATELAAVLCNDLQDAAISLNPGLADVLARGRAAGALAAMVSGSGPTCLFLARSAQHAFDLADTLPGTFVTSGPAAGAAVV